MNDALGVSPAELGLPPKFSAWRTNQEKAILDAVESNKRFVAQAAPTGFGKSVMYVAQAIIMGYRTALLTSTKALQTQLLDDFSDLGLVDVRGRQNYECCLGGGFTCSEGRHISCPRKQNTRCPYRKAYSQACASQLVVTNYRYWMLQHRYGDGLGKFDLLVCDEAHNTPDEICSASAVTFTTKEVYGLLRSEFPKKPANFGNWKKWAVALSARASEGVDELSDMVRGQPYPPKNLVRELVSWKSLASKLETIADVAGSPVEVEWCAESTKRGYRLDPVWPAQYAESRLFLKIPKILLISATIRPKTLLLLGIEKDESLFLEYPSTFPVRNSPVMHLPTVKVDRKWTEPDRKLWRARIDNIIRPRLDRKGIIHTVSYKRRDYIMEHSAYRDIMITHQTEDALEVVRLFRHSPAPLILVSPSMGTGWDFPYGECEYQIIAKVPFPDTRAKVLQVREEADKEYAPYLMAQSLVQSCGRANRAVDDHCENFIIDNHVRWVIPAYHDLFPRWFLALYRRAHMIPVPPAAFGLNGAELNPVPDDNDVDLPF